MLTTQQIKNIGLISIGSALEFYDFTIYALFASYLSYHFFPATDSMTRLINAFSVFALGYLARPLGGMLFGHVGDKSGRKSAFSLAIFLMATATLLIGSLPSYQSIGIFAPLLLVSLRLIQGFSVGGEIPGATVFTLEHVSKEHRGVAVGVIFMCITLGNTLGVGVGALLSFFLNQEAMMAWGWRIPFIVGFFLGIISFIIRIKTAESPIFTIMKKEEKIYSFPLRMLLQSERKNVLIGFLFTAISASTVSLFLYLPTYLSTILHLKMTHLYLINLLAFFAFSIMTAFFGWVSDYANRKKIMLLGTLLLIFSGYGLFYQLSIDGDHFIWLFVLAIALLAGMLNGCYAVSIAELFPINLRYSGMGFSYSLGYAIFGGLAPLSFTYLIKMSHDVKAPCYYLLFCAFLTLFAIALTKRHPDMDIMMNESIPI